MSSSVCISDFFLGFVFQLATAAASDGNAASKREIYKYCFNQLTWTLLIVFLVVFQLRFVTQNVFEGLIWFVLPCALVIMNDTSAYFAGFFFGKKIFNFPLTALSPNKTWEGAIGALFGTCIFAWFVSDWLSTWDWFVCPRRQYEVDANKCEVSEIFLPTSYEYSGITLNARPVQLHFILLALFASIFAPFGGFLASAIKRAYQIDDFSSVIPGHGGFTDRLDCQFLMLFCTNVHYRTFIKFIPPTVATLVQGMKGLSGQEQLSLLRQLQEMVAEKGLTP